MDLSPVLSTTVSWTDSSLPAAFAKDKPQQIMNNDGLAINRVDYFLKCCKYRLVVLPSDATVPNKSLFRLHAINH